MGLANFLSGGADGQQGLGGVLNRFVNPTNALGQFGKALSQASGGGIGDALTLLDQQKRQSQQDDMQQQIHQAQLAAMTAKQGRNQILQGHNGAVFSVDPETNAFTELRAPDPVTPHKTALQENFDYYTSLPPEQQRLLRPMMGGFANTEEGQQQAIARASGIADAQGQARSRYRAPPGGFKAPKPAATRVVGGKAYYKVNGAWYDNPEGK